MENADSAAIVLEGVAKQFNGKHALEPTDLEIRPRTCLALVGPSGCGKSTLLRLVIGLLTPDRGRVLIGQVPMEPGTRHALQLRMGYVIQEGGLFPHLTAYENVVLVARDVGWKPPRMATRVAELATLTGLAPDLLDRFSSQLSGGQRQRVGLMRALMLDPAVLLMDEPLAALDPLIRARLQEDLRALFARLQKTVLLVTHDMEEAAFLGDEIAVMRAGRILQRGSFADLKTHPADPFVSEFILAQRPRMTGREPELVR
jgi:osmoprotectant transport system ATP-binding protein